MQHVFVDEFSRRKAKTLNNGGTRFRLSGRPNSAGRPLDIVALAFDYFIAS
jgi:hypothetical protein